MKKSYTITYFNHTTVYKQLTVNGTQEQAKRFAEVYATQAHLMPTMVAVREVA